MSTGAIDYWCNAFTPDRRALWDTLIAAQGIPLKVRRDEKDSFTEPDGMLARMDQLGIATLLIPTCELAPHGPLDAGFEPLAARPDELAAWATRHPGRFVGSWSLDPGHGMVGVERAERALGEGPFVALHIHTHSFDRPLDHADYYPYYALAARHDVPVIMQVGASGGHMPSECGRPISIDRPAIYFPGVRFVLSHTGWPWETEAIAMALKFPNVYLGTATQPPKHWPVALLDFLRGPGRRKMIFGSGFPVCGHRHFLGQVDALELDAERRRLFLEDNARAIFTRLEARAG
jgi:predicted TIM-barrel fold metal-dependent hydrolase